MSLKFLMIRSPVDSNCFFLHKQHYDLVLDLESFVNKESTLAFITLSINVKSLEKSPVPLITGLSKFKILLIKSGITAA